MAYKKNPKKKDALSIKRAVESLCFQIDWGLKLLGAEKGDLFHQLAKVEVDFIPESWREQIEKKLLTIYYPEKQRNKVVDWAKANGYSTSSYLGRPIVKFKQLYLIIERTK